MAVDIQVDTTDRDLAEGAGNTRVDHSLHKEEVHLRILVVDRIHHLHSLVTRRMKIAVGVQTVVHVSSRQHYHLKHIHIHLEEVGVVHP